MGQPKPLSAELENALQTLETTRDYAAGAAAEQVVKAALRRAWLWETLRPLACLTPAGLLLALPDMLPPGWAVAAAAAWFAFAFSMDWLMTGRRRQLYAALNRWRQIAGTLAVTGNAP